MLCPWFVGPVAALEQRVGTDFPVIRTVSEFRTKINPAIDSNIFYRVCCLDIIFSIKPQLRRNEGRALMQFLISSLSKNDHLVYYLSGDLNYEGATKLKNAFHDAIAAGEKDFVFNLDGIKIISSHALSTILKLSYTAKKNDGSIKVICPEGNVWDIFYVLELGKIMEIFSSEDALWAALGVGTQARPAS
jgi:anti-anti-sigma factor